MSWKNRTAQAASAMTKAQLNRKYMILMHKKLEKAKEDKATISIKMNEIEFSRPSSNKGHSASQHSLINVRVLKRG